VVGEDLRNPGRRARVSFDCGNPLFHGIVRLREPAFKTRDVKHLHGVEQGFVGESRGRDEAFPRDGEPLLQKIFRELECVLRGDFLFGTERLSGLRCPYPASFSVDGPVGNSENLHLSVRGRRGRPFKRQETSFRLVGKRRPRQDIRDDCLSSASVGDFNVSEPSENSPALPRGG